MCGLITEKSIIAVFNICKLFTTAIFADKGCLVGTVMLSLCLCIKRTYFHCTAVITKHTHDLT